MMKIIYFVLMVLFSAGCSTVAIEPGTHPNIKPLGKIKNVRVQDVKVTKANGLLKAVVSLQNTSRKSRQIYYRFNWLDDSGGLAQDQKVWRVKTLHGEQMGYIDDKASAGSAVSFYLELSSEGSTYINN